MAGTTTKGLRYPQNADAPNIAVDIQNLASEHGLPIALIPLMFLIEVVSLIVKPFALTVRLFANMVAGHVLLTVFAVMCVELLKHESGAYQIAFIPLPFFGLLFMTAFEILVALLQAYIFTILSAVYIGESVHPEH